MRRVCAHASPAPSMRLSNLAANGRYLAYLHEGTLVALPDAAVVASAKDQHHTRLREPTGASFHSVRFLPPPINLLAARQVTWFLLSLIAWCAPPPSCCCKLLPCATFSDPSLTLL